MSVGGVKTGAVYYDVTNFLEKNKDAIHADVKSMMLKSTVPFLAQLMADKGDGSGYCIVAFSENAH